MPGTIVVAATATGVQPGYALFLGGRNVLKDVDGTFGVPLESIEIIEAGPGGVSSMEFTIDDPGKLISMADGTEVRFLNFWDPIFALNPEFRGFVDHWSLLPDFGTGRSIRVSCTGVEAWLDWIVVPAMTLSGTVWQSILTMTQGLGTPLVIGRGDTFTSPSTPYGTRGAGIDLSNPWGAFLATGNVSIAAGTTIRQAIQQLIAASSFDLPGFPMPPVMVTVDFDLTLRAWCGEQPAGTLRQPYDYATLTVTDTSGSGLVAEALEYRVEPGDPPHEVWVAGGNAAGTGLFGDGRGIRGKQASIVDASILDAATAKARSDALLAENASQVRGQFTLSDITVASTGAFNGRRAGGLLDLTDAAVGASGSTRIHEIRKRYLGDGRQTWTVAFGGAPPSASRLIRKLTRGVAA